MPVSSNLDSGRSPVCQIFHWHDPSHNRSVTFLEVPGVDNTHDINILKLAWKELKKMKLGQTKTGIIWLSNSKHSENLTTFKFFQKLYSHVDLKPVITYVQCLNPADSTKVQSGSRSLLSNVYSYMPPDRPANLNDILASMKEWTPCAVVQSAFEDMAQRAHKNKKRPGIAGFFAYLFRWF
ncbi:hypothetical protein C8J56DRAFT_506418 [Mycena floridula]|nr:hypothetical protein C8J56DRAFT_506418 [Mycena floridula]